MNTDIEIVESSLSSLESAQEAKRKQRREEQAVMWHENLKELLTNVPQAQFTVTSEDAWAYVDGIKFYYEEREYHMSYAFADFKCVRKFLWWKWVVKIKNHVGGYGRTLNWVFKTHLEALKYEESLAQSKEK